MTLSSVQSKAATFLGQGSAQSVQTVPAAGCSQSAGCGKGREAGVWACTPSSFLYLPAQVGEQVLSGLASLR